MRCEAQIILPMLSTGILAGVGWACCSFWFLSCTISQTKLIDSYRSLEVEKCKCEKIEGELKAVLSRPPPMLVMSPGGECGLGRCSE